MEVATILEDNKTRPNLFGRVANDRSGRDYRVGTGFSPR